MKALRSLVTLFCICGVFGQYGLPDSEYKALEDFYLSLHGEGWTWRNQSFSIASVLGDDYFPGLETDDIPQLPGNFFDEFQLDSYLTLGTALWNFTGVHNPCAESWQGLNCTCTPNITLSEANCTISAIVLIDYNIAGQIPISVSNFSNLVELILADNNITGTIPVEISELIQLKALNLANNSLHSSIPQSLGNCGNLTLLRLSYNRLTGAIPDEICNLTNIVYLNLANNQLDRELSPSIGKLVNLRYLFLSNNTLTGTIPEELGNCTAMRELYLDNNQFEQTIPDSLSQMVLLTYFDVYRNLLSGTIPAWFGGQRIVSVDLGKNGFYGSIPKELCYSRSYTLGALLVNSNMLTGTIPDCFAGSSSTTVGFVLNTNFFTGTIPNEFSKNPILQTFAVGDNILTGTVPSMNGSISLEFFYCQNNLLTGNLRQVFDSSKQNFLGYLDLSDNKFTGNLPETFYDFQYLRSWAMVGNCFTGSISEKICNMTHLQYLNFDGLHTAPNCRHELFPPFWNSYVMGTRIRGVIPSCLFSLPFIETIHMSGNALECTLPNDLLIGSKLTDVSLSHNMLKGDIPLTMQTRSFEKLDLSFNSFGGTLHPEFNLSRTTSLEVNRLSGNVPSAFRHAHNVKILNGNLFGCNDAKSTLPLHDPYFPSYQCGSNAFNLAISMWISSVGILILTLVLAYYAMQWKHIAKLAKVREISEKYWVFYQDCMAIFAENAKNRASELVDFSNYLKNLRVNCVRWTMVICFIYLPLYLGLSAYYSTHTHQYAWYVSSLYLSGTVPAVLIMLVYISMLILTLFSVRKLLRQWLFDEAQIEDATSNLKKSSVSVNKLRILMLTIVASINCSLMLLLNTLYVLFVLEDFGPFEVFVVQVGMSASKIVWNEYALTWILRVGRDNTKSDVMQSRPLSRNLSTDVERGPGQIHHSSMDVQRDIHDLEELAKLRRMEETNDMPILTFIIIFNTIIAPVIANAVYSNQCFQSVFIPPPEVHSQDQITVCNEEFTIFYTEHQCRSYTNANLNTFYSPPFIYLYGCTSSFIRHYADVYVYMFLLTGIGKPLGFALWKYVYESTKFPRLRWLMSLFLNKLLKEDQLDIRNLNNEILFRKERFVLNNVAATCVLLSIGVVFPPIAIVVLFATYSHTYLNQFMIGRFVNQFDGIAREMVVRTLCRDCQDIAILFKYALFLTIPFASLFYAFYLLDIFGDVEGWRNAMWASVVIFALPGTLFTLFQVYRLLLAAIKQSKESHAVQEQIGRQRAATIAAMQRSSYSSSAGLEMQASEMVTSPIASSVATDGEITK